MHILVYISKQDDYKIQSTNSKLQRRQNKASKRSRNKKENVMPESQLDDVNKQSVPGVFMKSENTFNMES